MSESVASARPDLAAQWHPTKNGELLPSAISQGSAKVVWWLHPKCGHEWDMVLRFRTRQRVTDCLVCANKRILVGFNDLATTHPHVADEWHPTKNGSLTPYDIGVGSGKKVWWQCKLGHEWQAIAVVRKKGHGCPYCAGQRQIKGVNDLATLRPDLASIWHPTKNGDLTPSTIAAKSGKKIWWQCPKGHEFFGKVIARHTDACPICTNKQLLIGFNDLATTHPQIATEWHPTLNKKLLPTLVTRGADRKVWWLGKCGHEWQAVVNSRTKGSNCAKCAVQSFVSRGEQEIADYLTQELGVTLEQSNRSLLKGTELDIYIPSQQLAIEYNGLYWHSIAMAKSVEQHLKKYEQAKAAGIQLLQVWEDEWQNKPALIKRLLAHKLGVSQEPLVGARQTHIKQIPLAEARAFLNEYHIQGHTNGGHYLGLRSQKTNQLVALMVLVKRASQTGVTLEITRYATSCRVPGGFTKLLKHVETALKPSRLVTFADHCISDGGLYASNGFTAEKELKPDYWYLVQGQRVHKFGYRLARFRTDPKLLWEPNLTETQLAALNGLHRVYDAGKTRWVKTL